MSVPKDKRKQGELYVNTAARKICVHVLKITGNEKNFPSDQEWFLNRFRDTALSIDLNCWQANNVRADSEELYGKRMGLQEKASDSCTDMLEMINVAQELFHMPSKRYCYLTDQYVDLRKTILKWHKSDRERLRPQTGM